MEIADYWKTEREGENEFSINHINHLSDFFQCWNKIKSGFCQRPCLGEWINATYPSHSECSPRGRPKEQRLNKSCMTCPASHKRSHLCICNLFPRYDRNVCRPKSNFFLVTWMFSDAFIMHNGNFYANNVYCISFTGRSEGRMAKRSCILVGSCQRRR